MPDREQDVYLNLMEKNYFVLGRQHSFTHGV